MTRKKLRPHIYTPDVWRHLSWNLPRFACLKDQQITLSHAYSLGIICSQHQHQHHHHHHHHQQQQQEQEQQQPSCLFFRIEVSESCLLKGCLLMTQICEKVMWKSLMYTWDLSGWGTALHDSQALREGDQMKLGFLMMDVSKNSGFSSKSSILMGVFHYKPSILGVLPLFLEIPMFFLGC